MTETTTDLKTYAVDLAGLLRVTAYVSAVNRPKRPQAITLCL